MPFGKHKGKKINELPSDYLIWCLNNMAHLSSGLEREMESALQDRGE